VEHYVSALGPMKSAAGKKKVAKRAKKKT